VWWQILFPLAAFALVAVCWWLRRWSRSPLAGLLFFVGTLFPVLGFFNVYPFRFSYVADHFQYLASLGIITLVSGGVAWQLRRWAGWQRAAGQVICAMLVIALGVLSWRQSRKYSDLETLYEATLAQNPDCLLAHSNLGAVLANSGRLEQAIIHYQEALKLDPHSAQCLSNMGEALSRRKEYTEALGYFRKALESDPNFADAHCNLAVVLAACGRTSEAIEHNEMAMANTNYVADLSHLVSILNNLGQALACRGQLDEAIARLRQVLQIEPKTATARRNLERALALRKQLDEAKAQFGRVFQGERNPAVAHNNLACALSAAGQGDEAINHCRIALETAPDQANVHTNLGTELARRGQINEAIPHFLKALELQPKFDNARTCLSRVLSLQEPTPKTLEQRRALISVCPKAADLMNETAWILATAPESSLRNGKEAIELAQRAVELSDGEEPAYLDTLAAAYAEAGRFDEAVKTAEKATELAAQQKKKVFAEAIRARIQTYKKGAPFRQGNRQSQAGRP
jgi:protein O-mannosyl-transferase